MSISDSRIRSNALVSEFASAEMSLHAIYMHEVSHEDCEQWPPGSVVTVLVYPAYMSLSFAWILRICCGAQLTPACLCSSTSRAPTHRDL